jgi:hypothetical protein
MYDTRSAAQLATLCVTTATAGSGVGVTPGPLGLTQRDKVPPRETRARGVAEA